MLRWIRYIALGSGGLLALTAPISEAVDVNGHCYVSGQPPVTESGEYLLGTVRDDAERASVNSSPARTSPDSRLATWCSFL